MDITQKYDPKISEKKWQDFWEQHQIFAFDEEDDEKEIYSVDTPPPTLSGKMHLGHAFSYSQQDFLIRYKRLSGFNVYYPFGTDDNGLATEKLVQKNKKVNLRKVTREEAIKVCQEYLEEERAKFIQDWKIIGMSCDFTKYYSTINDYSRKISQKTFLELAKKGLIERREGPVVWDRVFQTAIAQAELEDKKRMGSLWYIKAPVKDLKENDKQVYVIYATTRPEMLYSVCGMSVEDKGTYVKLEVGDEVWVTGKATFEEKFQDTEHKLLGEIKGEDLIGKKATIPFIEKEVEITHDEAVLADLGTGIAYFCSYGGLEDIEWIKRHKAQPIDLIEKDGRLNDKAQEYQGMLAEEARKKIAIDLKEKGHIIKTEQKEQIVNVGERSGADVEIIVSKQWYIKYLDQKEDFLKGSEELNWFPKHMKHRLDNWIKGLNWDWGFSRQRHYGIPIPVWYDADGKIYYPDESQLPVDPTKDRPLSAPEDLELIPEVDVLDTWFTSASTPFLAINLLEGTKAHRERRLFPMSLRPQSHDIINFWLFYTMAKTRLLLEQGNPWKDVTISGFVLDPKGNKMSKSKGNVIAPQDVVEKYSADAIRYWAATSKLGEDLPYQEKDVKTGQKFVNKLWNASKFTCIHLEDFELEAKDNKVTEVMDHWLLTKLQKSIDEATKHFDNYEYAKAKAAIEKFFWQDYCDQYLEIVKDRLYKPEERGDSERRSAQMALRKSLYAVLRMMAPITPFIAEEIYQLFFKEQEGHKSVHIAGWPKGTFEDIDSESEEKGDIAIDIINATRKFKSANQLSLKEELSLITLESKHQGSLQGCLDDLKAVLHVGEFKFIEKVEADDAVETENFAMKILIQK